MKNKNRFKKYRYFYKDKNFYKKQLNKMIIVLIILLVLLVMKKINISFTNKVIRIVERGISYEFSIKEDGKRILESSKKFFKLPEKMISVFKFGEKKDIYVAPVEGKVYKPYGEMKGYNGKNIFNRGVDIIPDKNNDIISIGDGSVEKIEDKKNLGYYVTINYGDFIAVYGHLGKVYVSKNDMVHKGQKIGSLGEHSSGNRYLHFEIWKDDNSINPLEIVKLE